MSAVNPEKYAWARELVEKGTWTPDPERGVVLGVFGAPIGSVSRHGYVTIASKRAGHSFWVYVHRVIWEYVNGPLDPGLEVNHLNGDKADNRIANLEAVTGIENKRHAEREGLTRHLRGEDTRSAKLTNEQVVAVFHASWSGEETVAALAERFGVSPATVGHIHFARAWRHVLKPLLNDMPMAHRNQSGQASWAKLTATQVEAIFERLKAGETAAAIAEDFGVSKYTVNDIRSGRSWRAVTDPLLDPSGIRPVATRSSRWVHDDTLAAIAHQLRSGDTYSAIARDLDLKYGTVAAIAKRLGLQVKGHR